MPDLTTFYYVIPKERLANILGTASSTYKIEQSGNTIICKFFASKITLSDHVVRERIYAGPTLGFVQGFVGTKAEAQAANGQEMEWMRGHLTDKAKDYML